MSSDSWYNVESHDWPAVGARTDLSQEQLEHVLDQFDDYYDAAIKGLSRVAGPFVQSIEMPRGPLAR